MARARLGAHGRRGDRARRRDRDDPARDLSATRPSWGSSRCSSARTPRASATSSPSPAIRRTSGTTRARAACTTSTRSASSPPARLNGGEDFSGKAIDAPTSFYVGVAVNPSGRRARPRDRALPPQGRSGRALRDDAGPVRHRLPRPLPGASRRRFSDPAPRRDLAPVELSAGVSVHNEVPGITIPAAVRSAWRRRAWTREVSASSWRAGCWRRRGRAPPGSTSSRPSRSPTRPLSFSRCS